MKIRFQAFKIENTETNERRIITLADTEPIGTFCEIAEQVEVGLTALGIIAEQENCEKIPGVEWCYKKDSEEFIFMLYFDESVGDSNEITNAK